MECNVDRRGIDNFLMELFNILDKYAEWSMIFILKWKIHERETERERENGRTYYLHIFHFFFLIDNSSYNIKILKNASDRSISNYRCLISILCFYTFQHFHIRFVYKIGFFRKMAKYRLIYYLYFSLF